MATASLVRINGLTKTFGEGETRVDAVRGLDLELERGEIILVMGPSGSGKTTLLSMLGALLRVTAGDIWIDGTNIAALGERELPPFRARTFGFIFQDFNLVAALSARENVEVALNIAGERGRPARERARMLLDSMGLADRLDFPVEQLSGGEKQRVAIARAIANHPVLILADEPTANLDSHHGAETMRLLRELAKEEATTVVIVSHDERLREIADRVLWLEDGQFKTLQALVRDPVCGMLIDPAEAPASLEHDGTRMYFCSRGCRDEFLVEVGTPTGYNVNSTNEGGSSMNETVTYSVPAIHCGHCGMSIREEVSEVEGVEEVDVDIDSKIVTIRGRELSDERLRAAIQEAGYEAA